MAKIYPREPVSSSPPSSPCTISDQRETYTVWMKSLVCHTNGCTAYDSKGRLVYRVDNYDDKSSNEVHLMDIKGRVVCTIRRKKFQVFGTWDGYRSCTNGEADKETNWFQVKKYCRLVMGDLACQVTVGSDKYWIVRSGLSAFKIVDVDGEIVAEVKPKQSSSGVALGDDVCALVVEPNVDSSLVMALVTVNGLINHQL